MCKSYPYRGLRIYENESEFGTPYCSIVNPIKKDKNGRLFHAHGSNKHTVMNIADCFYKIMRGLPVKKYNLNTRNKALRLLYGYNVRMK